MTVQLMLLLVSVAIFTLFKVAQLASLLPDLGPDKVAYSHGVNRVNIHLQTTTSSTSSISSTRAAPGDYATAKITRQGVSPTTEFNQKTSSQASDISEADNEQEKDVTQSLGDSDLISSTMSVKPSAGSDGQPENGNGTNDETTAKPPPTFNSNAPADGASKSNRGGELDVIVYSAFIVYVSFVKLFYHNCDFIKRNLTEPGILMVFGIIWEVIARQVYHISAFSPKFNARIFFYLFLPSTILESASMLSNKWLLFNLLRILTLSIIGTLLYASSLGYIIFFLSRLDLIYFPRSEHLVGGQSTKYEPPVVSITTRKPNLLQVDLSEFRLAAKMDGGLLDDDIGHNLTLTDCLILGTIFSSVDSTAMLNVFRQLQINDKLCFLTLGETLANQAVVLVVFNLLLERIQEARMTVMQVYMVTLQFISTLFGSILIGTVLAALALLSVRLMKHLQVTSLELNVYQNQCMAMVETLLILKLAYLSYTLAIQVGASSILSLVTFGILQDQYIKCNLNLRSQLTLRQVILAVKTLGYSLVYPILGMLLVDVVLPSQSYRESSEMKLAPSTPSAWYSNAQIQQDEHSVTSFATASARYQDLASRSTFGRNFGFITSVGIAIVVLRFIIVIILSLICNLLSSSQFRITFIEQLLLSYGGLKGPLSFALVSRLIDHEQFRGLILPNKHLLISTVLSITFVSTLLQGALIRPITSRFLSHLSHKVAPDNVVDGLFNELNGKLTEYLSQGLNSIIGQTKSPFDRFSDFNETHIKHWLTREGSNTNWLLVFHDNLILDETLNATSFHGSILKQVIPAREISEQRYEPNMSEVDALHPRRGAKVYDATDPVKRFHNRIKPEHPIASSNTSHRAGGTRTSFQVADSANSTALKQLVMYNLREEDAKMRYDRGLMPARLNFGQSSRDKMGPRPHEKPKQKIKKINMLSSTSSGDINPKLGTSFSRDKRRHLDNVERQLQIELHDSESNRPAIDVKRHREDPRKYV